MALQLHLESTAQFEYRVDLEDAEFTLAFRYADRLGQWLLTVTDSDGNKIITSRPCLLGVRMLKGNTKATRPAGDLVFVDTSSSGTEATFDDFGSRVLLVYLTAAEVSENYAPL
jgi:hypothetical protein